MGRNTWPVVTIGDIAQEVRSRNPGTADIPVLSVTKYDGFVPSLEYFDRQVFSRDTGNYKLVTRGQFAYATIHLDEGSIDLLDKFDAGLISPMYTVFQPDTEQVDPNYLRYLLKSPQFIRKYGKLGQGSINRRKSISFKSLASIELSLPPLSEQRRIAEILTSVDESIAATKAVIEQTRRVKQGMQDNLLSRGIWDDAPTHSKSPWPLTPLDSVAKRGSGHTPNKLVPEYWNGNIKWVSLQDSSALDKLYITDTAACISDAGIKGSSAVLHSKGTVILSRDAGVGKSAILAENMAVSQHFMAWTCGPRLDPYYLYYWLQHMKPVFERVAIGSTIKTIGMPFFRNLEIPLPSIEEQVRIAAVLKSYDSIIFASIAERDQLTLIKNGAARELMNPQSQSLDARCGIGVVGDEQV